MRRSGYLEKYEIYAARYGVGLRTVKRWGSLKAPLDVPERMAEWWEKNMTQRAPDSIIAAAAGNGTFASKAAPVSPSLPKNELPLDLSGAESPAVAANSTPSMELVEVGDDEMGVIATEKRMRNAEVHAYRAYLAAIDSRDEGRIRAAQRNWNDMTTQVRVMAKVAREDEIARRELIPRIIAETQLVDRHASIYSAIRGIFPAMARTYGIPVTSENEAKWQDLIDTFCHGLTTEVFTEIHDKERD